MFEPIFADIFHQGLQIRWALHRAFALLAHVAAAQQLLGGAAQRVGVADPAFALIPVSLLLDIFDGAVARWRRKSSYLGADLDSLADIVSFGVAPAGTCRWMSLFSNWDGLI